jgi:hypothetical protein
MSRGAALVTQAHIQRIIRAAKAEGAGSVSFLRDGSSVVSFSPSIAAAKDIDPDSAPPAKLPVM